MARNCNRLLWRESSPANLYDLHIYAIRHLVCQPVCAQCSCVFHSLFDCDRASSLVSRTRSGVLACLSLDKNIGKHQCLPLYCRLFLVLVEGLESLVHVLCITGELCMRFCTCNGFQSCGHPREQPHPPSSHGVDMEACD